MLIARHRVSMHQLHDFHHHLQFAAAVRTGSAACAGGGTAIRRARCSLLRLIEGHRFLEAHLAIAIGIKCVQSGKIVRFFTAADLVMALERAKRENTLEVLLKDIAKSDLIVIDELGYVPLSQESARLLFQVMSDCYERRSLVITTNIEFSKWGVVFGDDKLASAIIDRIMHHGRLVEFGGASKRLENALMLGKSQK